MRTVSWSEETLSPMLRMKRPSALPPTVPVESAPAWTSGGTRVSSGS